jgi:fructose-1,6-bisphosphatase/sedoheptulose 1,7-bisphosphatase-like protein
MQGILRPRNEAERARTVAMGVDPDQVFSIDQLATGPLVR